MWCGAVAEMINKYLPGYSGTPSPGVDNIKALQLGEIDIGTVLPDQAAWVYHGQDIYKGKQWQGIRALYNGYSFPLHIMVLADSPIKSMKDLKGKKIGSGPPTSYTETHMLEFLLEAHGVKPNEVKIQRISLTDRTEGLADKQLDCIVILVGHTSPGVQELVNVHKVRYLSIDEKILDDMNKKYPYYLKGTLKAGLMKGTDVDVKLPWMWGTLVTTDKLPDEVAYQIVKLSFEHKDEMVKINPILQEMTLENAIKGLDYPVHPGALKYYKEKGIVK